MGYTFTKDALENFKRDAEQLVESLERQLEEARNNIQKWDEEIAALDNTEDSESTEYDAAEDNGSPGDTVPAPAPSNATITPPVISGEVRENG